MRRLETRLDYKANHMSTWMREDLTELQVIQLSFDISCVPRIASPVARHGQLSGRSKATDEHEASVIAITAHSECLEAIGEHRRPRRNYY